MKSYLLFLLGLGFGNGQEGNLVPVQRTQSLYTFQGCYQDHATRAMQVRVIGSKASDEMCYEKCKSMGYHYFAVQYYRECFCHGTDPLDRAWDRYGKKHDCTCENPTFVGGWSNCVYRIWPDTTTAYLPEAACLTPASKAEGAEISVDYCAAGGLNVYNYNAEKQVQHAATEKCLEMRITDRKMRLHLATCNNNEDAQKFDVLNDCEGGNCDGSRSGNGFWGECPVDGDCALGKIWNHDIGSIANKINVAKCKDVQALDPNAQNSQYNVDGHDGDVVYCDFNTDYRVRSQANTGYCLNWSQNSPLKIYSCGTHSWGIKLNIRESGMFKAYGLNHDHCFYVDGYGIGPIKIAPCLNRELTEYFQWTVNSLGQITPKNAPNMCMDIQGGSVYNGAMIQLYPCHGGLNQRWIF